MKARVMAAPTLGVGLSLLAGALGCPARRAVQTACYSRIFRQPMFHGHGAIRLTTKAATNPATAIHAPAEIPRAKSTSPITIKSSASPVRLSSRSTCPAYREPALASGLQFARMPRRI